MPGERGGCERCRTLAPGTTGPGSAVPNTDAARSPLAQVKRPDLPPSLITYRLKRHKQNYLTMLAVVVAVSYYQ